MTLLPRMVGGHHVFAAVFDPFDRAAEAQRGEAHEKILGIKFAAHTEPPAGVAFLKDQGGGAAAEHARQRVAIAVRHLSRSEGA